MKITDVKHRKVAKKYADALLQTAQEKNKSEKIYDDIVFISETIETNEQLKNVLINPIVGIDDKKDIVKKLFEIHIDKITLDFTYLLIENGRLDCLSEIVNCYNQTSNINNNIITPTIISAVELSETQKSRIVEKLEKKTNKTVLPEYSIEPDIIGGIIVEIDDKTIDCSLKTKFENMKKQLTKGNSYGNN